MKTITLQGTEKQINNFILDNELLQLKENKFQLMETRVYLVNPSLTTEETDECYLIDDEFFIEEAERQGTVYTIAGFQEEFNSSVINSSQLYVRFIETPISANKK